MSEDSLTKIVLVHEYEDGEQDFETPWAEELPLCQDTCRVI